MYLLLRRIFSVLIVIFYIYSTCQGFSDRLFATQCIKFTDNRTSSNNNGDESNVLLIPTHLTNGMDHELKFYMRPADTKYPAPATQYMNECKIPINLRVSLRRQNSLQDDVPSKKYYFQDQRKFDNNTYFTSDGYIHHHSNFLNPLDYCVQSISDTELNIQTCKVNCSADLSKNEIFTRGPDYESSRICIPKCCGVDETLSVNDQTCRKLNDKEANYFLPYLHLPQPIWFLLESKTVRGDGKYKALAKPTFISNRDSWNSTFGLVGGIKTLWNNIHFFRSRVNCTNFITKETKFDDVKELGKTSNGAYNYRIEVASGMVRLTFLTKSRKWVEYKKEFCVDGMDHWGNGVSDKTVSQVLVLCVDDNSKKFEREVTVEDLSEDKYHSIKKYALLAVKFICCIFLLFGFWIFITIKKKLNLNGKIIASHLASVSLLHLWTVAAMSAEGEYSRIASNAVEVVSSDDSRRIGWVCVGVGVLCHYLYLTCFIWLSVIGVVSWELKNWASEYWIYGICAWGIPIGLVQAFCLVDWLNNDPFSDVTVPDYAVESCFVASWSAGYYVYLPNGLNLGFGLVLILVKVIPNLKEIFKSGDGSKDKAMPFKFFTIVWFIQAVVWIVGFTEWIRVKKGYEENWLRTLVLMFAAVFEACALLYVYCMNEVVLGLFGDKIPRFQGITKFLKNKNLIFKGSGVLGHICEQDADDTVVIEGEELVRRG